MSIKLENVCKRIQIKHKRCYITTVETIQKVTLFCSYIIYLVSNVYQFDNLALLNFNGQSACLKISSYVVVWKPFFNEYFLYGSSQVSALFPGEKEVVQACTLPILFLDGWRVCTKHCQCVQCSVQCTVVYCTVRTQVPAVWWWPIILCWSHRTYHTSACT